MSRTCYLEILGQRLALQLLTINVLEDCMTPSTRSESSGMRRMHNCNGFFLTMFVNCLFDVTVVEHVPGLERVFDPFIVTPVSRYISFRPM